MGYIEAVEAKGWQLYDVSDDSVYETWEERSKRKPATKVEQGGIYLFAPQPQESQTLSEVYEATMGIGPCLRINGVNSSEYRALKLSVSPQMAFFASMAVERGGVVLLTPPMTGIDNIDVVILPHATAEETFTRDFDVVSPNDFEGQLNYVHTE